MNIVACVKQVPDTEAQIKVKPDGSGIEEGGIKWVMNPYDEFGVEEALRLKEKNGGEVTIVCLGPARAMETVRTARAMGADKGIHICDPAFDGADAYTTASALAAAIKEIPHDIIFCGQRAIDDDSAQVGAILAELLGALDRRRAAELSLERWRKLSQREQEVTALVCLKLSNQEIAERLVLSPETVKTHMRRILQKLDLHSKAELRLMYADWEFSRWLAKDS